MKRRALCTLVLAVALLLAVIVLAGCGGSGKTKTLNVYNWGEYISDGSEGSFDTIAEFEKWYKKTYGTKVEVNYQTFPSNEDMYSRIKSGAVSYDVIIPSDYMIAKMIDEDMLLKLDYKNIPNAKNIDSSFNNLYYDANSEYSIPYTYGIVGVIYNANVVDEADTGSWDLMWNPKYSGKILQFNNPRDAFGTAFYKLNYDVNSTDRSQWDDGFNLLVDQKSIRYGLVMDEIFNLMESGEAAIGAYYAGDYFTMVDSQAEDVDLQFYYPELTNYYIDAMCIPSCCQEKELAEIFINYMLSEEPAIANAEYTYYASPNSVVYNSPDYIEEMGEEAMSILYPDIGDFSERYNQLAYKALDNDTLSYMNSLWEDVKLN